MEAGRKVFEVIQRRAHVLVHSVTALAESSCHLFGLLLLLRADLEVVMKHDAVNADAVSGT